MINLDDDEPGEPIKVEPSIGDPNSRKPARIARYVEKTGRLYTACSRYGGRVRRKLMGYKGNPPYKH